MKTILFGIPIYLLLPMLYAAEPGHITSEVRKSYIQQAQVWKPTDVSKVDIVAGPQNEISVPPETDVTCEYQEWKKAPTGATPKFKCKLLNSGATVRVKYGKETREVFAEVAASRLFWALGFYADEYYPVRLHCLKCPEKNPFQPEKEERRIQALVPYATIEREYPGVILEEKEDQGWSWSELDQIDPKIGGATRSHVDALKLLAVFVQHGDNRSEQQRLGCAREDIQDGHCLRPIMMVDDLGSTFGRSAWRLGEKGKMNIEAWLNKSIWNRIAEKELLERTGQHACIGNLTSHQKSGMTGMDNPVISEEGRKFLAGLLNQLSDEQIRNLFQVARADKVDDLIEVDGVERRVTLDDWISAFHKKREEINSRKCVEGISSTE